jgi:FkbM family methyltransferase
VLTKTQLKLWLRSRSLRFALDGRAASGAPFGGSGRIRWNGQPVYYRIGTSDVHVIHSVLLKGGRKAEYWIPRSIQPATVLDIGGNIGAAAIYFARIYPQARIFSFEPIAENFALLERNILPYKNIRGFNLALGPSDESAQLIASPDERNLGGYSIFQRGATPECVRIRVSCRAVRDVLLEIGAQAPDLIKIDTEGSEFRILTALPENTLSRVMWIVGELHGENDFELLAYLSKWFEIGIRKSVDRALCNFHARNRDLVP